MSGFAKKFLKYLLIRVPLAFVLLSLALVLLFKFLPVLITPYMVIDAIENRGDADWHLHKTWVPLERISPQLRMAVIAGEDQRFFSHRGFDREEMQKMWKDHREKGKKIRGCSTISQQTAKNVFTFCSNTALRKGLEAWWTLLIERIWGKERILEVYLNVAEMGPGVFGAEAAARNYFGKAASALGRSEACLIAACLPNPVVYRVDKPSQYVLKRRSAISSSIVQLSFPEFVKNSDLKP
ncbi:MAG: monofunctional biosynthetic peptidoglycan transglycosylase [Bacteroidales bacterium]|nr:monofunctional biosynthetic peptidoglycan transglycosylase [Bacteroidales bacterium]